jgi:hypothetical protein
VVYSQGLFKTAETKCNYIQGNYKVSPPKKHSTHWDWVEFHKEWLGVRISTIFEIFGHFMFKGDGTTPHSHDLHTIRCSLTQEIKIYNVYGLGFSRF